MKTLKLNFLMLLLAVFGLTVAVSCSKDKDDNKDSFNTENLDGTFVGVHKFTNIPDALLKILSESLPGDTLEDGTVVPVDLTKGFDDTLTLKVENGVVKVHSELLAINVDGKVTGNNRFSIPEIKYDVLVLGKAVEAKKARIKTSNDVIIGSNEIGTVVDVRLSLSAQEVAGVSIPLTILTKGDFVKTN